MNDAEKKKWDAEKKIAKAKFVKQMKERKEKEMPQRLAKKKLAMTARKLNRVKFIQAQQKCFKRLFKVTVGMMCMTCDANYGKFFVKDETTSKWQLVMNKKVCTNLMKDCYPYLKAQNLQGKNMLDMKRMKKFQKNKEEITKKLTTLKKKIAESDSEEEIVEALQAYQTKLKATM
jgi:hypothetical protein